MTHLDVVVELIRQSRPETNRQKTLLRHFSEHFRENHELLPQLISIADARLAANDGAASFREGWERLRWEKRKHLPNFLLPFYARVAVVWCPRLNGMIQFVPSASTDGALGTWIAACKLPGEYARRLQWADGIQPVPSEFPAQGALFR